MNEFNLPAYWKISRLSQVAQLVRGVSYRKKEVSEILRNGYTPLLRATNIQNGSLIVDRNLVYVPSNAVKPEQHLQEGDIVVCMSSGSKNLVGKTGQLKNRWDGTFGTFCAVVRPNNNVNKKFLGLYFSSPVYRKFISKQSVGININNLKPSDFELLEIPIPPIDEQEVIVSKIEEQFSKLNAGVEGLKRVQAALKRYRASVLKAACEGRLVPQDPNDEPALSFLSRKISEKPRLVNLDNKSSKIMNELPLGWAWVRIDELAEVGTGATPLRGNSRYYIDGTIPWITSKALNNLYIDEASEFITEAAIKETNTKVFPSGSLVIAMYGEGRTRGKVSELRINAATNQACAVLIFTREFEIYKPFVKTFLQHYYHEIRKLSSGGVQPNLNLSIIKKTLIPLPPKLEQLRIVSEADKILSIINNLDNFVDLHLKKAQTLRRSILADAFRAFS